MLLRVVWFLVFALFVGCGSKPVKKETNKMEALTIDGNARLSDKVVPTRYELDLTIDPNKETFSGTTIIEVTLSEPTTAIHLHAEDLTISKATIEAVNGTTVAEVKTGSNTGFALLTATAIPAGTAKIKMEYTGPLDEVPTGLYRVKDGDSWYAFTQFEPLEARQAFPSFDEPRFKTPYKTTMRVPTGSIGVTNNPTVKTTAGEMQVYEFSETKPLPTYLVAFAVGPFDVVEAAPDAIKNVPFRILTTKGKGAMAQYMLKRTPSVLATLTEYFGQPYPYEKLDVVAVPNFSAGAMENVGLVTFRERLLLLDPNTASVGSRRSAMSVMAHELAHMWFGNLVTMPWWDDLWLNEAFATWMALKVVEKNLPELEADVDAVSGLSWVMRIDSEENTRAIRQPINNGGDVYNAFDGLTYRKGAAVIRMFESHLGADKFRDGVRTYLKAHEHGSATTTDFLSALDNAAPEKLSPKFATFLDQPGVPLLEMNLTCDAKAKTANLTVKQSRYLPAGSKADPGSLWSVPFCVKFDVRGETKVHCDLSDVAEKKVALPTDRCPKWFYPNADERGYYHWSMNNEKFLELVNKHRKKLTVREKVGLYNNITALARSERLDAKSYVSAITAMSKEKHRSLVSRTVRASYQMKDVLKDEAMEVKFQKSASKLVGSHFRRVGVKGGKRDNVENKLIRPRLIGAMGDLAKNKKALKFADKTTKSFLKDPSKVPNDLASVALQLSAEQGDETLWNNLKEKIATAPTPSHRVATISALGTFKNPELQKKSLALTLDGTLRSQDFWTIVGPTMSDEKTFAVTWDWFTTNYDQIVSLLGNKRAPSLPRIGSGFCTADGKEKLSTFFGADTGRLKPGGDRNLKNTLEKISQCERFNAYLRPAVVEMVK